ncbi:MAG: hypothetical protein LBB39_00895 [Mycoplasmataceae bacterium]|jgi:hypothetical protein|nr:hypothetical protein [Mycoplasmataceae bacterium]
MNKKVFLPLTLGLVAVSFISFAYSLTSCNKDSYKETTLILNRDSCIDFVAKNHITYNDTIPSLSSNDLKDYFFMHNRLPGINLVRTAISVLGAWINNIELKIGYNSNSCYAELKSDVTSDGITRKKGSYGKVKVTQSLATHETSYSDSNGDETETFNAVLDKSLTDLDLSVSYNKESDIIILRLGEDSNYWLYFSGICYPKIKEAWENEHPIL